MYNWVLGEFSVGIFWGNGQGIQDLVSQSGKVVSCSQICSVRVEYKRDKTVAYDAYNCCYIQFAFLQFAQQLLMFHFGEPISSFALSIMYLQAGQAPAHYAV